MNANRYPILKLFIPLVFGIVAGYYLYLPQKLLLLIAPFFVLFLPVLALILHFWRYKWQVAATILFQIAFLFAGFFLTNARFFSHLSHKQENLIENSTDWIVHVADFPVVTDKSVKLVADIEATCNGEPLHKKAILYFKKDSAAQQLRYGDRLLLHTKLSFIAAPKNPYTFDYKRYMQRRSIFFTAYIQAHAWQKTGSQHPPPLRYAAKQLQQHFTLLLAQAGMSGDEYSVITAILLGDDDTMNAEIRQSYASAGVSHILCVSGMHVGIIFMFLNFLLKPMDLSRKTALIKALLLLATIWLYAHITGLSPSVKRAAAMFTFVAVGGLLRRNTDIFHSLFTSCFVLLLLNPLLLFDVGFQLSYLSVTGIVTFQPHILRLWKPKTKLINYLWELTTVSVAAQLSTFPLSVYYFGQFPNYFLIANLAVIMLSSVVVITGIVTLGLSFSTLFSGWSAWLLTKEIGLMNTIIRFVEQLPGAVTDRISLDTTQVFVLYFVIIMLLWIITYGGKRAILACLSGIALFGLLWGAEVWRTQQQEAITCYAMQGGSALSFNFHGEALLLCDSSLTTKAQNYKFNILNHECTERINSRFVNFKTDTTVTQRRFCKQGNFICFGNKILLLAQSNERYYPEDNPITVDYLLVRQNTKCRLEYMTKALEIKQVIIDESNNAYTTQQWQEACQTLKIDCWNVREQGAFGLMNE